MTYCILAAFSWAEVIKLVDVLPMIVLIVGVIVGFATGLRKMPRLALMWMAAAKIYSLLLGVLQSSLGDSQPALPVIVATVSCAIVAVLVFAVTRVLIYPYDREIRRSDISKILEKEDKFRKIEAEELEELRNDIESDEDDIEQLERKQRKRRKRYLNKMDGKASFLSRLLAAAVVGIGWVFVANIVVDILVLSVSTTPLADKLAPLCELETYKELVANADKTTIDYLIIGIFMYAVFKGYECGVLNVLYSLFSSLASMAACALGFYIPFSPIGAEGGALAFTAGFANKIGGAIQAPLAGMIPIQIPETIYQNIGKVAVGLIYTIVFLVVMWIITRTLRKSLEFSYNNAIFRAFDGAFGVVLGIILGVVAVAVLFFGLLLVEKIGWYSVSEGLFADTQILEVLYAEFSNFASGWADKVVALLPFGK